MMLRPISVGAPAQAVARQYRGRNLPSPGGNLPSDRYLTHCLYSQQHHNLNSLYQKISKIQEQMKKYFD